jgi:hypothetical protein
VIKPEVIRGIVSFSSLQLRPERFLKVESVTTITTVTAVNNTKDEGRGDPWSRFLA